MNLYSYFKEMTSGCETLLPVFNISDVKVYIHRTYTRIISLICIIKSIRRSTQGSSIRIDIFGFALTLNSNKLEKKDSKNLR